MAAPCVPRSFSPNKHWHAPCGVRAPTRRGRRRRLDMRMAMVMALLAAIVAWGRQPRADEAPAGGAPATAPPPDPTRGQWDAFLDPLRDFEDNVVTGTQKNIEDATK